MDQAVTTTNFLNFRVTRKDHLEKLTDFYQRQLEKLDALTGDQLVSFFELSLYLSKEGAELSKSLNTIHQKISDLNREQLLKLALLSHKDFSHYLGDTDLKLMANTFIGLKMEEAWELMQRDWSSFGQVLFCCLQKNRDYPGFFIHKNEEGCWSETQGKRWNLPVLGKSSRDLEFFQTNGNTPTGFYTMDSVMPKCDKPELFGKFHRVKIHFLSEKDSRLLDSSITQHKVNAQAQIASLFDRTLLRIHGTGEVNTNTESKHYPHIKSAGCLTTRECEGFENDQKYLLDILKNDKVEDIAGLLVVIDLQNEDEMEKLKSKLL